MSLAELRVVDPAACVPHRGSASGVSYALGAVLSGLAVLFVVYARAVLVVIGLTWWWLRRPVVVNMAVMEPQREERAKARFVCTAAAAGVPSGSRF